MMSYFKNLLTGVSQFGGAICGINCDCSISATTGYYSKEYTTMYWVVLESIIDFTFYPVDGDSHCLTAYHKDPNEYYKEGFKTPLFILALAFCIVLGFIFWTGFLIGRILNKFVKN